MSSRYDAIVIGGGPNGLTAATLLAKAGRRVVILERRDQLGGVASSDEFHPGYRSAGLLHDTSSLRRWVVDKLELKKFGLEFHRHSTPVLIPQKEGPGYLHFREPDKAKHEISVRSKSDARNYKDFRRFIRRVSPTMRRVFDEFPPDLVGNGLRDLWQLGRKAASLRLLGKKDMMEVLRVAPMSVADWVEEWFDSEILRAAIAAPAVTHGYTGPWSPGTSFNLLLSETQAQPSVKGGPAALVRALASAATAAGVEIRTGSRVVRLNIVDSAVSGVTLDNGETLEASTVAASCHPQHLFLQLIPANLLSLDFEKEISCYRSRGTAAKVNLALSEYPTFNGRPDAEPMMIRTGTSINDLERAFDAVKYRDFSNEPMLEIYVPTLEDSSLAPPGHHVFSVLIHWVPYDLEGGWTDDAKVRLLETVLDNVSVYSSGLRNALVGVEVQTPVDLETEYGLTGGHLYQGEHAIDQMLSRPTHHCNRYSTPFAGLFLCGSGSHPGGGLTCAPGALAIEAITDRNGATAAESSR
jgi:phytoene dehydrogenase-like protein